MLSLIVQDRILDNDTDAIYDARRVQLQILSLLLSTNQHNVSIGSSKVANFLIYILVRQLLVH